MAGFRVTVEARSDDFRLVVQRVRNLGEDPRPLMEIAGSIIEASVLRRFDTGRGPGGIPWPKSRRAIRQSGKTLVDKGNLEGSLRHVVRSNEVEIGFDGRSESSRHASAHQGGSHRQTVVLAHQRTVNSAFGVPLAQPKTVNVRPHGRMTNLPARPMLGIDDEDRRDLLEAWLDHLRSLFS